MHKIVQKSSLSHRSSFVMNTKTEYHFRYIIMHTVRKQLNMCATPIYMIDLSRMCVDASIIEYVYKLTSLWAESINIALAVSWKYFQKCRPLKSWHIKMSRFVQQSWKFLASFEIYQETEHHLWGHLLWEKNPELLVWVIYSNFK